MRGPIHECVQDWFQYIVDRMRLERFIHLGDLLKYISQNVGMGEFVKIPLSEIQPLIPVINRFQGFQGFSSGLLEATGLRDPQFEPNPAQSCYRDGLSTGR